jgi:hypothetical protein
LSLALFALVVVPHVHASAAGDNPNHCPIWAAHGPAGAAVDTPEIALAAVDYIAASSDPPPSAGAPIARVAQSFSARAPPASTA